MDWPPVTIILPVLDERAHIESSISDLLAQDYPDDYEIVVADGGSQDGTKEYLEDLSKRDPRVRLVDNPRRRQAFGLNQSAAAATGEILVRADGHSRYAPDFVTRSVAGVLELDAAVGGRMNPVGHDRFSKAVAAAMNSPLTMGPGRFHHATEREQVDTVYLGAFRKSDYERLGGMRSFPSGSSEDADFYFRWREAGGRVFVDPAIRSSYTPRNRVGALWRQYWRYGQGKAEMMWVNGRFPSRRPLAPLILVIGLLVSVMLGLAGVGWLPGIGLLVAWATVLGVAAARGEAPPLGVFAAAAIMHLAYGLGVLWGLVRGPRRLRSLRR